MSVAKTSLKPFPAGVLTLSGKTLSVAGDFVFEVHKDPMILPQPPCIVFFGIYLDSTEDTQIFWAGKRTNERTFAFPEDTEFIALGAAWSDGLWGAQSTPRYNRQSQRQSSDYANGVLSIPSENYCVWKASEAILGSFIFNYYAFFQRPLRIGDTWATVQGKHIGELF